MAGGVTQAQGVVANDPTIAAITGGTIKVDDGSIANPSLGFATDAAGFYHSAANQIGFASGGGGQWTAGPGSIVFTNSTLTVGWTDTILSRDGTGILALKNANAAMESRVYAGNGGFISQVKSVTESLTIAAAATTVGATSIPAGAILLGVAVRVTTVIPTAATFTITTTVGGTTLNTAAVSSAANSTDPGTAAGASYRAAATTVTITPNLTPGAATGVVRLQYYYLQVTPPTS